MKMAMSTEKHQMDLKEPREAETAKDVEFGDEIVSSLTPEEDKRILRRVDLM